VRFYTENEKIKCFFSGTDEEILAEFADIIPTTKLSREAAGVASFISIMIKDCYPAAMQHAFAAGLKEIESAIQDYNENFLNLSPDQNKS
jgi:hypothetical protein